MLASITYGLLFVSLFFEVFLLVSFLERIFAKSGSKKAGSATFPLVAVIVPCLNEEKGIAATIHSLLSLDYPKDKLEILVVDDGSTDTTLARATSFAGDPRVRVFSKANGGKHTAMNYALERTNAEFIGCLDADSVVEPEALRHILPAFSDERIAAVTPGIHVKTPRNLLQHMQHVEYRLSIFNRFILSALGSAYITPGPFSIFRTTVVRGLGGWKHGHSAEDMEMALRIQSHGMLIANAPRAIVYTAIPQTVRTLFRQRVRWTYGFIRNIVDYRHMIGSRRYGNLGVIILPFALISIVTAIYFFLRVAWSAGEFFAREYARIALTGDVGGASFGLFYINTSAMIFLTVLSITMILLLISAGSWIGTGSKKPPLLGTPLFLFAYCFLVPTWLVVAVVRAAFRTDVRWR